MTDWPDPRYSEFKIVPIVPQNEPTAEDFPSGRILATYDSVNGLVIFDHGDDPAPRPAAL